MSPSAPSVESKWQEGAGLSSTAPSVEPELAEPLSSSQGNSRAIETPIASARAATSSPSASATGSSPTAPLPAGQRFERVALGGVEPDAWSRLEDEGLAAFVRQPPKQTVITVIERAGATQIPLDPSVFQPTSAHVPAGASLFVSELSVGGRATGPCASIRWAFHGHIPEDPGAAAPVGEVGVTWDGQAWKQSGCAPKWVRDPERPRPPRALDDALLRAPIYEPWGRIAWGTATAPMLSGNNALYLWGGQRWSAPKKAPWDYAEPRRLANGSTLVVGKGAWVVDPEGALEPVVLVEPSGAQVTSPVSEVVWTGSFPVLTWKQPEAGDDTYDFFAPKDPDFFRPADAPAREASAQPPAGDSGLEPPAEASDGCSTPFVLLQSPTKLGDRSTGRALSAMAGKGYGYLQDDVTFVEYQSGDAVYFGAQTRTPKAADALVEAIEKHAPKVKPERRCVDVLSKIPDRYAPPAGIRVVGVNLATGERIPLD